LFDPGVFKTVPADGEYAKKPATFAVASSSADPRTVPKDTGDGGGHVITGAARPTQISLVVVMVWYLVVSPGVKTAVSFLAPALFMTVSSAGEYLKAPSTLAVAFNCAGPRMVPKGTQDRGVHAITGTA
jgi:hypothetical protein